MDMGGRGAVAGGRRRRADGAAAGLPGGPAGVWLRGVRCVPCPFGQVAKCPYPCSACFQSRCVRLPRTGTVRPHYLLPGCGSHYMDSACQRGIAQHLPRLGWWQQGRHRSAVPRTTLVDEPRGFSRTQLFKDILVGEWLIGRVGRAATRRPAASGMVAVRPCVRRRPASRRTQEHPRRCSAAPPPAAWRRARGARRADVAGAHAPALRARRPGQQRILWHGRGRLARRRPGHGAAAAQGRARPRRPAAGQLAGGHEPVPGLGRRRLRRRRPRDAPVRPAPARCVGPKSVQL